MPRVPHGTHGGDAAHGEANGKRREALRPWSVEELNRLLAAARHEPGELAGIPAARWWPALVLTLLDTAAAASDALAAPRAAYDRRGGRLALGLFVHTLHPLTVEALDALAPYPRDWLLPWPKDKGGSIGGRGKQYRRHQKMLCRDYRRLLFRAGLAHVRGNLFRRLRTTALACPGILDRINPRLPFAPRADAPRIPRAPRTRGPAADAPTRKPIAAALAPAPDGALTILQFFRETYQPIRLAGCSPVSAHSHLAAINSLNQFAGRVVTMGELCDDLLQRFLAWCLGPPLRLSPATVNSKRAHLLAQWNFGWTKRVVPEPPRDVQKVPEPERLPEAWSQDELGRLLTAAAAVPGSVSGIPAALFWPALVSLIYETGLRITAAMSLRCERFDAATGWIVAAHETQKQHADQAFKLYPDTVRLILATRPAERDLLFPWPYKSVRPTLCRRLRKILRGAGLPAGKRDLFHKIRRTHATSLADARGEEAARISLGHSCLSVTRRYLDPRKMRRRSQAVDALDRPAWSLPAFPEERPPG